MEEIDIYLQKLKEDQEIKDYIDKGIYPERLQTTTEPINITYEPLREINLPLIMSYTLTDNQVNIDILNKVNRLENEIKETISIEMERDKERENNNNNKNMNENDCPICLENMGDNNYIVPSCGHKICMNCFIKNLKHNNVMSKNCCLCRKIIIPIE